MKISADFDLQSASPRLEIRKNTRVHFNRANSTKAPGHCVGTIWMCNPAGLRPPITISGPLHLPDLTRDPTMGRVIRLLEYALAVRYGGYTKKFEIFRDERVDFEVPPDLEEKYVAVLNLFYAVDSSIAKAWRAHAAVKPAHWENPPKTSRFILLAWGHPDTVRISRIHGLASRAIVSCPPGIKVFHSARGGLVSAAPTPADNYLADHPHGRFFNMTGIGNAIAGCL